MNSIIEERVELVDGVSIWLESFRRLYFFLWLGK